MIPRKRVKVTRRSAGTYSADGLWTDGTSKTIYIDASVQPTTPADLALLPEGRRQNRAYTLYTSTLLQTAGEANPDIVTIDDEEYEVTLQDRWANSLLPHKKAIVTLRANQTGGADG